MPPQLATWFASLPMARELVLAGGTGDVALRDPLRSAWAAAEADAVLAYEAWRESRSAEANAVYRAAAARADAAQDAFAAAARPSA
jgi:hypothetical protein